MHDLKGAWPPLAQGQFETGLLVLPVLLLAAMIGRILRSRVSGFILMFATPEEKGAEGAAPALIHIPNGIFFQKSLHHRVGKHTESLGRHLLATPLSADFGAEQTAGR